MRSPHPPPSRASLHPQIHCSGFATGMLSLHCPTACAQGEDIDPCPTGCTHRWPWEAGLALETLWRDRAELGPAQWPWILFPKGTRLAGRGCRDGFGHLGISPDRPSHQHRLGARAHPSVPADSKREPLGVPGTTAPSPQPCTYRWPHGTRETIQAWGALGKGE